ncbi:MAG: nucleotide exchange factor GrpE [Clostridia bacterium]|nr:nucleotide exchange factor GrpE [Clostridia bacterium]
MSKKKPVPQEEEAVREENPVGEETAAEVQTENNEEPEPAQEDPKDTEIQKLREQLKALQDQQLRTLAEYDNFRKRTEKEKLAIYTDATVAAAAEILTIADNIERALEVKDADAQSLRKGIEMIETQLRNTFKKLGVEEMAGVGEEFNPDLHNAVAHIEDENLGENVVSAVYQKGYLLGDKVVRHAMVQVAN